MKQSGLFGHFSKKIVIISMSTLTVLIVIVIISVSILVMKSSADSAASTYQKELDSYVAKLQKQKQLKVSTLTPIIKSAPTLPKKALSGLSSDYKKAEAKAAALEVYQNEIFLPTTKYDIKNTFSSDAFTAEATFSKTYADGVKATNVKLSDSTIDFSTFKSALKENLSIRSKLTSEHKTKINALKTDGWNMHVKDFYTSRLDNTITALDNGVKAADKVSSYAELRSLQVKVNSEYVLPSQYVYYPLYAADALKANSALIGKASIDSLPGTLKKVENSSVSKAKATAYLSLYGKGTEKLFTEQKNNDKHVVNYIAGSYYLLWRLQSAVNSDISIDKTDKDTALETVNNASNALAQVSLNVNPEKSPSGIDRSLYLLDIIGKLSNYDGYTDILRNYKSVAGGATSDKFAIYNQDTGKKTYDEISKQFLPNGYFTDSAKIYKSAADDCYNLRAKNNKSKTDLIKQEIDIAMKRNELQKQANDLLKKQNPSADDRKKVADNADQINSLREKFNTIESKLSAIEKSEVNDLSSCQKKMNDALMTISEKSKNRTAQNNYILEQISKLSA